MYQPEKRLTAEEISRARDKAQKKREKKKQIVARAKEETRSAHLGIHSTDEAPNWELTINEKPANQEWKAEDGHVQTFNDADWQVREANADWPWVGVPAQLLTQAPYALNEHNAETSFFRLPQEVQVLKPSLNDRSRMLIMSDISIVQYSPWNGTTDPPHFI